MANHRHPLWVGNAELLMKDFHYYLRLAPQFLFQQIKMSYQLHEFLQYIFFDLLAPGGSDYILGVTFTFIIVIEDEIVDQDQNGKADVFFREIYYNDKFSWNKDDGIDVETVALHEAGHGLSQGHFGKVFGTDNNPKIHFAPRDVMNASYSGVQTAIENTYSEQDFVDWRHWPNN